MGWGQGWGHILHRGWKRGKGEKGVKKGVKSILDLFDQKKKKGSSPFLTYLTSNDRQSNYGTTI
jgi:hypothetical protein